jgi:hypothetical protein
VIHAAGSPRRARTVFVVPAQRSSRPAPPQPPDQQPGRSVDVEPQGVVHCRLVRSRAAAVGSANVLVVDEELVEVRESAHPVDAEEARRRSGPDRRHEIGKVSPRERFSSSFREGAPCAGQDKPGPGDGVVLAEDEVRGQIVSRPRRQEGRRPGAEFGQQVVSCARSTASNSGA